MCVSSSQARILDPVGKFNGDLVSKTPLHQLAPTAGFAPTVDWNRRRQEVKPATPAPVDRSALSIPNSTTTVQAPPNSALTIPTG